ncbi:MAG: fumarylacetoacetate hydrolase family protein [Gammaproteobacteria bacterium]|nr:fumarylacetoacetate hydrolase family protein [Gammaproteobacteria bacterium]
MRLVRYGEEGLEKPGLLDDDDQIRSLAPLVRDINPELLAADARTILNAIDPTKLPIVDANSRLGMPVVGIRQIIAVAGNYRAHVEERGKSQQPEPMIFHKSIGSLCGPADDIILPPDTEENDWEVELGILIGQTARRVSEDEALNYVGGYCVLNDITERHWQHQRAGQFGKGKSFDSFTPIGPWLVTPDEVGNPQALNLWLDLNGNRRQEASTDEMVYGVAKIISYISQFMTLEPGDLIASGTCGGVGAACSPPEFLQPGDELKFGISKLGVQQHAVSRV